MRTAIIGGRVLDGTGDPPIDDGLVVVSGNVIEHAGHRGGYKLEGDISRVDARGKTILPGLFNCHAHLCHPEPQDPEFSWPTPAVSILLATKYARQTLESGVTTVRDMGSYHDGTVGLRDAIARGVIVGPRILVSVRPITITGGHWHFVGVEADGPDDVRRKAREQLKAGADHIKLMATAGVGTPGQRGTETQFTREEIAAAVDVAERAGKRVAAHAHADQGVLDCVEAGVTTIEHGSGISQRTATLMAERGVFLVPTMQVLYFIAERGSEIGVPAWKVENSKRRLEIRARNLPVALREGVLLAFGTDSGGRYSPHGEIVTEMKLLHDLGVSTSDVIHCATLASARACGMDDRLGSLEAGKLADVVVVDGNPLDDFEAFRKVVMVLKEGELVVNKSA